MTWIMRGKLSTSALCRVAVTWIPQLVFRNGRRIYCSQCHHARYFSHSTKRLSQEKGGDGPMESTKLDVEGWAGRWQDRNIGFHKCHVHSLLIKYLDKLLCGQSGMRIFVPLCGKTLDMKWLSDLGHTVVGVEGAEQAILEFFTEQNLEYTKEPLTNLEGDVFKSKDGSIIIYRCDFYQFARCKEGEFHAVWDRCSMVAVNTNEREQYGDVLKTVVSSRGKVLLVVVDYTKNIWPGPPHIMEVEQVKQIFSDKFEVNVLERQDAMEERWRQRGISRFEEIAILLSHKS